MHTLAIDIETYSSTDLMKSGVYKYTEAPDFTILLVAYSFNGSGVDIIDVTEQPEKLHDIRHILVNPNVLKTAYNANFERTCLSKFLGIDLPADQWECTMVRAAMCGLPLSLDMAAKVLNLDEQKDASGKSLIRYFSVPCKPTARNGNRTRNLPMHDPFKWEDFKSYCMQDVRTELAIREKLSFYTITDKEKALWALDQKINDTGILLDPVFVQNAISIDAINKERLTTEAIRLTSIGNPNSAAQLKEWLSREMDSDVSSLSKKDIPDLLSATDCDIVSRVLTIRQEMAKTSVKKYDAMLNGICEDNRLRGLLQFYGANRTGRWAGRLVQVQNLPQNHLSDLELARTLVRTNDADSLEMCFGNVPDTLSQLIRTSFVAGEGKTFIVADFSAIEARVIAWLATEKWRLDVFKTHGKIYEASAAQMFRVPIETVTKGSPLRQKGKVAELALGYQGGANALIAMGALNMGIEEKELKGLVNMWRDANKAIVRLWDVVEDAALGAVSIGGTPVSIMHGIRFFVDNDILFIELPSGRRLSYIEPRVVAGQFGPALTYKGMDQTTKQWRTQYTYGGKLVENIVQAIARDCLAEALLKIDAAGFKIVMHVHDEAVIEIEENAADLEAINRIMGEPVEWAKGLPLTADSYSTPFYKKD
jgi:DNA polymerase